MQKRLRTLEEALEELESNEGFSRNLPTAYLIGLYIRQSTEKQVKKNKQSTAVQDEDLRKKLIRYGWLAESIVKFDNDQGKSGQKRIDQRVDMNKLYSMIERGEIKAVAAYDASRLFRDLTRIQSSTFLDLCTKHDIPVITYHRIYWPSNRVDNKALHDAFEQAADFIDEVVYGKLIPAKNRAIFVDKIYVGGMVPMGYVVDYDENSLTYRRYTPYEPHAERVRYLFKRFRELGGNVQALGRELIRTNFRFPLFVGIDHVPHVAPRKLEDGYSLVNRSGLITLLTNYAYIGWYVRNGVIVSKDNHTAIVSEEDFWYAHNRLSKYMPDGEQNENRPRATRYSKDGTEPVEALLQGVLRLDNTGAYTCSSTQKYIVRSTQSSYDKVDELAIGIKTLDTIFVEALLSVVAARREQEEKDGKIGEGIYARLKELQAEKDVEVSSIDSQLEQAEKLIKKHERLKAVAEEEDNIEEYRVQVRKLKQLNETYKALEAKSKEAATDKEDVEECETLIECVMNDWKGMKLARKLRFVNLVTESVNLTVASQHFLKMEINFKPLLGCSVTGYIYRRVGKHGEQWTGEEKGVLEEMYPYGDRADILKKFPERTWETIVTHARLYGLKRHTYLNTSHLHESYTLKDVEVLEKLGLGSDKGLAGNSVYWLPPTERKKDAQLLLSDVADSPF
ncbi:MAG TPA: recombinase family protein [Ktedonosporobacter sp.]|jgi:hypothetical protein|nr:recombinase family protein [Ktedonosporobacter sp.]